MCNACATRTGMAVVVVVVVVVQQAAADKQKDRPLLATFVQRCANNAQHGTRAAAIVLDQKQHNRAAIWQIDTRTRKYRRGSSSDGGGGHADSRGRCVCVRMLFLFVSNVRD